MGFKSLLCASAYVLSIPAALAQVYGVGQEPDSHSYIESVFGGSESMEFCDDELRRYYESPVLRRTVEPLSLWHGGRLDGDRRESLWVSSRKTSAAIYGPPVEIRIRVGQTVLDASSFLLDHPMRHEAVLFYKHHLEGYARRSGYGAVFFGEIRDLPLPYGEGDPHPVWVLFPGSWREVK